MPPSTALREDDDAPEKGGTTGGGLAHLASENQAGKEIGTLRADQATTPEGLPDVQIADHTRYLQRPVISGGSDLTTQRDGTKVTINQQRNDSISELTQKGEDVRSLRTHEVKPGGGFIEKTTTPDGMTIHDQSANGDYVETNLDKKGFG